MIWINDKNREHDRVRLPDSDWSGDASAKACFGPCAAVSLIDANRRGGARGINRGEPL